eukprot:3352507-Amphidinium_carterae.3
MHNPLPGGHNGANTDLRSHRLLPAVHSCAAIAYDQPDMIQCVLELTALREEASNKRDAPVSLGGRNARRHFGTALAVSNSLRNYATCFTLLLERSCASVI